jgi:hypothetical protein
MAVAQRMDANLISAGADGQQLFKVHRHGSALHGIQLKSRFASGFGGEVFNAF